MQEQEPVSRYTLRASVHLGCSPAGRRDGPDARRGRHRDGVVGRTAVGHDNVQRSHDAVQIIEQGRKGFGFVEGGDHDPYHRRVIQPARFATIGVKLSNTSNAPATSTRTNAVRVASLDPERIASAKNV